MVFFNSKILACKLNIVFDVALAIQNRIACDLEILYWYSISLSAYACNAMQCHAFDTSFIHSIFDVDHPFLRLFLVLTSLFKPKSGKKESKKHKWRKKSCLSINSYLYFVVINLHKSLGLWFELREKKNCRATQETKGRSQSHTNTTNHKSIVR